MSHPTAVTQEVEEKNTVVEVSSEDGEKVVTLQEGFLKMYDLVSAEKVAEMSELVKQTCPQETLESLLKKIVEAANEPIDQDGLVRRTALVCVTAKRMGLSRVVIAYIAEWLDTAVHMSDFFFDCNGRSRGQTFTDMFVQTFKKD